MIREYRRHIVFWVLSAQPEAIPPGKPGVVLSFKVSVTNELLEEMYGLKILPSYNDGAPKEGRYGWLRQGTELSLAHEVNIEQNVGLYGGAYVPMAGGRSSSGLTTIGAFSFSRSPLPDTLEVGRYWSISQGVRFIDSLHPLDTITTSAITFRPRNRLWSEFVDEAVKVNGKPYRPWVARFGSIGNDVWIGDGATISHKVSIGTGAVVAAGAMVTKDVPPYAIVGGNPAKVIRYRFDAETVDRLLASYWWTYDPSQLFETMTTDVDQLLSRVEDGELEPFYAKSLMLAP